MHRPNGKIRAPKRPIVAKSSTDDYAACWREVEGALIDIHNQNAGRLSFEQLYRTTYKIVIIKKSDQMHDDVADFEARWFKDRVIPPIYELLSDNLVSLAMGDAAVTSANERREAGERFLRGLRDSWERHRNAMNMVADVMMYRDRGVESASKKPPIFHSTIGLYRDHILGSKLQTPSYEGLIQDVLTSVVLDLIDMEREGNAIDRSLIRHCLRMLEGLYVSDDPGEDVKLYTSVFEPRFLGSSRRFYAKEAAQLVREANASTWLNHTQRRLDEERERCQTTISNSSEDSILLLVDEELVSKQLQEFMDLEATGLRAMIANDRHSDLQILFRLNHRVDNQLNPLRPTLQKHIVELGVEIEKVLAETDFSAQATPAEQGDGAGAVDKTKAQPAPNQQALTTAAAIKWVDDVLALKDKFDKLVRDCFDSNVIMEAAITSSFADFINVFQRSSEYVSLYIDDTLKHGIRDMTEAEVDVTLGKAITLIRFLQDKDMFERYYQKHLAKRLLHSKSESIEAEKQMISRMKQEIGTAFTSKFEGMYKDMDSSRELTSGYREYASGLADAEHRNIDLGIRVLTSNHWPQEAMGRTIVNNDKASRADCHYPPVIESLQQSFLQFYLKTRSGRVLNWLGSAGTADIKCVFPKVAGKDSGPLSKERRYELSVSTHGMIVLMLFNDLAEGQGLSYEQIADATGLQKGDLSRVLASLSIAPKSRVLAKEPANKFIKPGDKFAFNESFQSKMIRIKAPIVSAVAKVEDEEERKGTETRNDEARAHVIDAAIVRIMKARKELAHNNLLTEVVTQVRTRFKPEVNMIKKRIEDLIAREYLDRSDDPEKPSTYTYLA